MLFDFVNFCVNILILQIINFVNPTFFIICNCFIASILKNYMLFNELNLYTKSNLTITNRYDLKYSNDNILSNLYLNCIYKDIFLNLIHLPYSYKNFTIFKNLHRFLTSSTNCIINNSIIVLIKCYKIKITKIPNRINPPYQTITTTLNKIRIA